MEEKMNGKKVFNQLKKNIEDFERDKANGTNALSDFTFKCMCVYPLIKLIEDFYLTDLNADEQQEFDQIKEKYS